MFLDCSRETDAAMVGGFAWLITPERAGVFRARALGLDERHALPHPPMAMALAEKLRFLSSFLARPNTIGAVAPSSPELARRMTDWIDWSQVDAVVEYGPGTGAFTDAILQRKKASSRIFLIERESNFIPGLRQRFPRLPVYHDCASSVQALCSREGVAQIDAVVSGLPWAAFPESLQQRLLDAMMTVLKPRGQFATFAYLHGLPLAAARRFRRSLQHYFSEVSRSPVVWRNLPPALVYQCRR